ncbi:MAG: flagellar basal body-associated FliL family protein [Planctomycetes bacterium]|nr:flagellar basal body-associated FliL family protein [Planctomycetota bacterium]
MKKKPFVAGLGGLGVIAAIAFFVVGSAGVPHAPPDYTTQRGTETYYTGETRYEDLAPFIGNLKGSRSKLFVKVSITVVYRLGPEILAAKLLFTERKAIIADRLNLIFGAKGFEDVEGAEHRGAIKEEIKTQLQAALFPDKRGRIEDILYREFYVQ